ncbi:MAG: MtrB/PioB family decaheme-associated outer membrane protein [Acidobacteria bacterium]|nr:MtrB/PioB family decaheme-associated outer membrane protein [Acidobacteriota bacterium]
MKTHTNGFTKAVWGTAGRGAALAIALVACAHTAAAQTAQEATKPISAVEFGGTDVSDGAYKAGEYNGLQNKGGLGIGHFDLRGGAAYNDDSALRWRIKGADLGLDTRSLSGEVGAQGVFRFNFGFDQLRRNRSDSYQTPLQGAGSNVLTLPGGWQVPTIAGSTATNNVVNVLSARGLLTTIGTARYINTQTNSATFTGLLTPTAGQISSVSAASLTDVPAFQNYNLHTTRTKFDLAFDYSFDPRWGVSGEFRPEHKDGVKPMGTVSRNTGGDISTIIPDVVDTNTYQTDMRVNFRGAKGFAQAAYYGSIFKNNVPFMQWQNWATGPTATGAINFGTAVVNTMSSTPGNQFHQFSGSGGFNFSPTAKLVVNGSVARNTQNDSFLADSTTPVVPVSSLNGLVINQSFTVKFNARPAKKLSLTAGYKYDNRDNRTAVHVFQYSDAGEAPAANTSFVAGPSNPLGAVLAQNANANRAYSKKTNQANGEADFALSSRQWLKGSYEYERNNRDCYSSWISCADAAITNEHSLRAEYRATLSDDLTVRVGYTYSARRTPNYNENAFLALVPYTNVSPAAATGGATAYSVMVANGWTGWGPASGYAATTGNMNMFFPSNNALANAMYGNLNRISELPGMRRYYAADRNRDKIRTSATWQATDELSFQGNVDYNKDHYADAIYGLQDTNTWAANVEGMYAVATDLSLSVFYTYEDLTAGSAGNTYTANSNTATLTGALATTIGLSGNSCDGFTTLQQRNNNNKLDPCLNWFTDRIDKVNSAGVTLMGKEAWDTKLDLTGNFIVTRARSDNTVTGGNWANNLLMGPGAAPTTTAAYFIAASALPTVSTDTYELRLNGRYAVTKTQALHLAYTYMRMTSVDWMYEGMQFGSLSGILPSNEQPFNYSVHVFGVSYVLSF